MKDVCFPFTAVDFVSSHSFVKLTSQLQRSCSTDRLRISTGPTVGGLLSTAGEERWEGFTRRMFQQKNAVRLGLSTTAGSCRLSHHFFLFFVRRHLVYEKCWYAEHATAAPLKSATWEGLVGMKTPLSVSIRGRPNPHPQDLPVFRSLWSSACLLPGSGVFSQWEWGDTWVRWSAESSASVWQVDREKAATVCTVCKDHVCEGQKHVLIPQIISCTKYTNQMEPG